jgi:hypothetical protein
MKPGWNRNAARALVEAWLRRLPRRRHVPSPNAPRRPEQVPPMPVVPAAPAPDSASAPGAVVVTVLGLAGHTLQEVIDMVARAAETAPAFPVFVTDSLDFDPFRARRLRFEYFPDRGTRQRFASDLDWDLYERRRYALLRDKWRPRSLIWFGRPPPADCVALINARACSTISPAAGRDDPLAGQLDMGRGEVTIASVLQPANTSQTQSNLG